MSKYDFSRNGGCACGKSCVRGMCEEEFLADQQMEEIERENARGAEEIEHLVATGGVIPAFVMRDTGDTRLAYINPVTKQECIVERSDWMPRWRNEYNQLHCEYVHGVATWIQRKVVFEFNTFSVERWL